MLMAYTKLIYKMKIITDGFKGTDATVSFWQLIRVRTRSCAVGEELEAPGQQETTPPATKAWGRPWPCRPGLCDLEQVTQPLWGP